MLRQETNRDSLHLTDRHRFKKYDPEDSSPDERKSDRPGRNSFSQPDKPQISIFDLDEISRVDAASLTFLGYRVQSYVTQGTQSLEFQKCISALINTESARSTTRPLTHKTIGMTSDVSSIINQSQISMVFAESEVHYNNAQETYPLPHLSQLIGKALKEKSGYHLIIYRADLLPGTTENTLIPILEAASGKRCGADFGVCVVPYFLSRNASIYDYYTASRTIIGGNDNHATTTASNLYKGHINAPIKRTSLRNAESIKFIENSWRVMRRTFQNEIERVCRAADIDAEQVLMLARNSAEGALLSSSEDSFIYGYTDLEKDLKTINYLAKKNSVDLPLIENLTNSYDAHIDYAVEIIRRYGHRKIGILGHTNTSNGNVTGSSLYELTARLETLGYEVQVYDPAVKASRELEESHSDESTASQSDLFHAYRCHSLDEFSRYNDIVVQTSKDPLFASCEKRARLQSTVINLVTSVSGAQRN